ncbi:hypothetical protein AB0B94_30370 [Micromonospora sp. NPDC048986]|uniref:hypothetical protein n=1 Tax=Micromonospora sp. NPDC048986 TaxID=3155644 RepID=UPI0033C71EBD
MNEVEQASNQLAGWSQPVLGALIVLFVIGLAVATGVRMWCRARGHGDDPYEGLPTSADDRLMANAEWVQVGMYEKADQPNTTNAGVFR